ncbi:MAG: sulfur reduction protein DsrE [Actinobacteria bacterium]|nr:sulfur reduction protein DsrE [Actinomycetota bacterium]
MKVAIFIYEPIDGDASRVYRALRTAHEFVSSGDEVAIVFDGSGTEALAEILRPGGKFNSQFLRVKEQIAGACKVCSKSHQVADQIAEAGIELLDEFEGEASVRKYLASGYAILNY